MRFPFPFGCSSIVESSRAQPLRCRFVPTKPLRESPVRDGLGQAAQPPNMPNRPPHEMFVLDKSERKNLTRSRHTTLCTLGSRLPRFFPEQFFREDFSLAIGINISIY